MNDLATHQKIEFTYSVQIPGGAYITRKLREGETVSVGSDGTADLRLESPGIAGMHCLLSRSDHHVNIKDCYSPAGTYVNGQKIQSLDVTGNCCIKLQGIEIQLKRAGDTTPVVESPSETITESQRIEPNETAIELESNRLDLDDTVESFTLDAHETEVSHPTDFESLNEIQRLMNELEESKTENAVLRERLDILPKQASSPEEDPIQKEMIDLMRQEIEALQQELEKRNSEQFQFDLQTDSLPVEAMPSRDEVERLVIRLEELLEELEGKDEQIQVLQDLVLASETANQAEQEEREQLTKWLGEFEGRFEDLAGEWQAENDLLKRQLEKLEEERISTMTALASDTKGAKAEALRRMVDSQREQLVESQTELHFLKEANTELRAQLEEAQNASPKEEEIRLARERAEIARMRHDLEVKLHKATQSKGLNGQPTDGVEQKLRDLTQELRDSHNRDKPNASLSSRFLSLWSRLNS